MHARKTTAGLHGSAAGKLAAVSSAPPGWLWAPGRARHAASSGRSQHSAALSSSVQSRAWHAGSSMAHRNVFEELWPHLLELRTDILCMPFARVTLSSQFKSRKFLSGIFCLALRLMSRGLGLGLGLMSRGLGLGLSSGDTIRQWQAKNART